MSRRCHTFSGAHSHRGTIRWGPDEGDDATVDTTDDDTDRRLSAFSMHLAKYDLSYTYVLGEILGSGVSANVHHAIHQGTGEMVAIKVFKDASSHTVHGAATEYLCAMRAAGPHALEYHSLAFINGKPALVMELATTSLDKWIQKFAYTTTQVACEARPKSTESSSFSSFSSSTSGSWAAVPSLMNNLPEHHKASSTYFPPGDTVQQRCITQRSSMSEWLGGLPPVVEIMKIMTAILEGLVVMHEAGLSHCDLKPCNILLMPDGSAKIADFGATCAINSADGRLTTTIHGTAPPDKEIDVLVNNFASCIRPTEDSMSVFGSAWGAAANSGSGSSRTSAEQEGVERAPASRGSAAWPGEVWPMAVLEPPPPLILQDSPKISSQPEPFVKPSCHSEPVVRRTSVMGSKQQQAQVGGSHTLWKCGSGARSATSCSDFPVAAHLDLFRKNTLESNMDIEDSTRALKKRSSLLRSFRSCPGEDEVNMGGEVRKARREVQWTSMGGSTGRESKKISRSATDGGYHLVSQRCSRMKAYSLRTVPMFTSTYSSPERSNNADQRKVDVWAAGCILYELCTGKPLMRPQPGVTIYALMAQLYDPDWTAPEIPSSIACWRPMLAAMLCRDAEKRALPRELLHFDVLMNFRPQRPTVCRMHFSNSFNPTSWQSVVPSTAEHLHQRRGISEIHRNWDALRDSARHDSVRRENAKECCPPIGDAEDCDPGHTPLAPTCLHSTHKPIRNAGCTAGGSGEIRSMRMTS